MAVTFPNRSDQQPHRAQMFEEWSERFPKTNSAMTSAIAALTSGYKSVWEQCARLAADETATPGARVVKSAKAARSKLEPLFDALSAATEAAGAHAAQLQAQTAATYLPPQNPPYALVLRHQEIRAYLRGIDNAGRMALLENARKNGDEETLIAVTSAPSFLSGIQPQLIESYQEHLIGLKAPDQAATLRSLREQQQFANQFRETMLQSLGDLIDFRKADELIEAAREDVQAV
jgi:hypothetical protein